MRLRSTAHWRFQKWCWRLGHTGDGPGLRGHVAGGSLWSLLSVEQQKVAGFWGQVEDVILRGKGLEEERKGPLFGSRHKPVLMQLLARLLLHGTRPWWSQSELSWATVRH